MPRPHIEFIFAQAFSWSTHCSLPDRSGLEWKVLSSDAVTGEVSAIVRFPPGWAGSVSGTHQEEIYVLDGEFSVGEMNLQRDGYARLPADLRTRWKTAAGAVLLVFLNRTSAEDESVAVFLDPWQLPWDDSGIPTGLDYMRLARKPLFSDLQSGEHRTWLLSIAPQVVPSGAQLARETHPCAEEMLVLAGDIVGPQGVMTPGAYFWRPRDTLHGPYGSRYGAMALFRFRDGEQQTLFHSPAGSFRHDAPYRPDLPTELADIAKVRPPTPARY